MNGSVDAITQVGNKIIAAGTFTSVSPAGTFGNTGDDRDPEPDLRVRRHHRRHRPDVQPQPRRYGQLPRHGRHVHLRRRQLRLGGRQQRHQARGQADRSRRGGRRLQRRPEQCRQRPRGRAARGSTSAAPSPASARAGSPRRATRWPRSTRRPGPSSPRSNVGVRGLVRPRHRRTTTIKRFDVSPDGSRLVALGNFATAGDSDACPDGDARRQRSERDGGTVVHQPLTTTAHNNCAAVFDTFMRDVDFSPDGSYFVISTTGAFAGGVGQRHPVRHRRPAGRPNSTGNDPTWADYTGGDTTYGVAATGSAVYIGGHMRWQNNPFQGDQAGPGAVPRPRHRRPRPGQRPAAVVEPRPDPRRRRPGAVRDQPGSVGRQ